MNVDADRATEQRRGRVQETTAAVAHLERRARPGVGYVLDDGGRKDVRHEVPVPVPKGLVDRARAVEPALKAVVALAAGGVDRLRVALVVGFLVDGHGVEDTRHEYSRPAVKVLVLTTSYPRGKDDPAGSFVAQAVEGVRRLGVEVDVVSPDSFGHLGLAYGHGIVGNIRRRPWLALLVPLFLWRFRRAAAGRECDLVHAHWLAAGAVAATLRKPYVVQVWGTDLELARRVPWAARWIVRRAALVLAASEFLAGEARRLGARAVCVVPSAVAIPEAIRAPDEPPHVLFAGRLSPEKGIQDFLAATDGIPRVVVGAGPIDVPESVGAVPPAEIGRFYERAAVVCVPSRREGYGMVAREAMAYGRPVVATPVGGLLEAVDDGATGLLAEPASLRDALERLIGDAELRRDLGAAARAKACSEWAPEAAATSLLAAYDAAAIRA